jgi:hypothetical protein
MMIPAEIGHPVRLCSLAHVWEHLPSIDGIDKGQLFELHAHHVTISNEGPSVSCVVVHHDEGPIAGATFSLVEWFGLPTPSELLEIPDTASALFDDDWVPQAYEPSLNVKVVTAAKGRVNDLLNLIQRWESGRPITRTLHLLEDITHTTFNKELIVEASQTMEIVMNVASRRNPRRAERMRVIQGLERVTILCSMDEKKADDS